MRSTLTSLESSSETAQLVKAGSPVLTMKPMPAPKELGKGSLDFEVTLARDILSGSRSGGEPTKGAKAKTPPLAPLKLHMLVVPEAAQTWIAVGGDRAKLVKTMLASLQGAPESGTLATRQDLGTLKNGKFIASNFFTLESLLHSWVNVIASRDEGAAHKMQETRSMLSATPNKGRAPLLLTTEVAPGDDMAYTLRVDVPKGYIEDAIILIASSSLAALTRP